jgi:hypothetical protein
VIAAPRQSARAEEGSMSKAIILRTKDDGRIWLISFDRPTISEISASTARGLDLPVTEVETFAAAGQRSAAASFPAHVVQ